MIQGARCYSHIYRLGSLRYLGYLGSCRYYLQKPTQTTMLPYYGKTSIKRIGLKKKKKKASKVPSSGRDDAIRQSAHSPKQAA